MAPLHIGIGVGVGRGRRGTGGVSPLSITAPTAYSYLTSASPYDFGGTITLADTEDAGGTYTFSWDFTATVVTLPSLTGLTGSGNGTTTGSYSGTLAAWNAVLAAAGNEFSVLSDASDTSALTLVRDADSLEVSASVSVTAWAAAVAITTSIATRQAFQRGRANIVLNGTYPTQSGDPAGMEWRVGDGAWTAFSSETIGSGNWQGTLDIPTTYAAQGTMEVRCTNLTAPPATVANITVTDIIAFIGQSNINSGTNAQTYTKTNWDWAHKDLNGAWGSRTTDWNGNTAGSFGPAFAETVDIYADIPPATFLIAQSDGTGFVNNNWNPGDTLYESFNSRVSAELAKTGGIKTIVCVFNETDAQNSETVASWKSNVDTFLDDIIADNTELSNTNFLWPVLGELPSGDVDAIRQGVLEVAVEDTRVADGPNLLGFDWGDGIHYGAEGGAIDTAAANAQLDKIGALYYRAAFEETSYHPDIINAVVGTGADAAKITVTFDRAMENHTDETGWSVTDDTGACVISSAAQGSSTSEVVLTCSVALYGAVTVDFGLGNSAVGATLQEANAVAGVKMAPQWTEAHAATGVGVGAVPVNTVAPAISGNESVGNTLTCSTGTWTGVPMPTYAYQWYNNDVAISGETSSTYTLQASDEGDIIHCTVTATNAIGSASADSNDTGAIASAETVVFSIATDGTSTGASATNCTFTTNVSDSDGGADAISFTDTGSGAGAVVALSKQVVTFNNGDNIVRVKLKDISKNSAARWVRIRFLNLTVGALISVDLTNGSVGSNSGFTGVSFTALADGWYQFEGTTDLSGADVTGNLYLYMADANSDQTITADTTNTVGVHDFIVSYV
jgi:hypothetical protein